MSRATAISCWKSAFVLALIAEHLSTWAEEWILWSTAEFNFLKLPQEFCTGSSIMPQKINPDVLELTRGKTARVIGNLQALLVLVKGLPLAYNRDLQEDKERIFDSFDTVELCLELAAPLVAGATLNRDGDCREARPRAPRRDDADGVADPARHAAADGPPPGRATGRHGAGARLPAGGFDARRLSLGRSVAGRIGVWSAGRGEGGGGVSELRLDRARPKCESRSTGGSKRSASGQLSHHARN